MKITTKLSLLLIMAVGLFSCTAIKNPQSANFQRVKYNSHIKFAKKSTKEKLPETVSSFDKEDNSEMEASSKGDYKPIRRINTYKNLTASVNAASASPKKSSNEEFIKEVESVEHKSKNKTAPIFNANLLKDKESNISSYLNSPAPVASEEALGDILYVILVVLLILIVISLIADLAGGLVGALIAVLLILFILRLLGYV